MLWKRKLDVTHEILNQVQDDECWVNIVTVAKQLRNDNLNKAVVGA